MLDLVILNCHALVPGGEGGPTIRNDCEIRVVGGKIVEIADAGSAEVGANETIDAAGMMAMPGLINTHSHSPMVLFRGLAEDVSIGRWFNDFIWPLESNLTSDDVYWGMKLALVEMIEGGVTTVAEHYFHMDRVANAVAEAGTRGALGSVVFGDSGYDALSESAEFAEEWNHGADGRITTWMAPHAPYTCDDDFLSATVAHAQRLGIGIHTHAAEEMGQTRVSLDARGKTPIQVLADVGVLDVPTIIAHGCGIMTEDVVLLGEANAVGVAHAPKTYMKLGMGLTPIRALHEAGVPVGLGTDGPASNNTLDVLESLRLMAMLQKHESGDPEVMTIPEALRVATEGSAAVVGLGESIGRLEAGYQADIVLVDMGGAHHQPLHSMTASLVYNTRPSDVATTIVDGRVLMMDRQLLTLDKAEIIGRVRENMGRLARRVPGDRIQEYNT